MERLTNEETTSELKKDMRRMLKKGFEAAPIALRYIALSKYEDTGLTPDEIEYLQKENAELQSQLSKAVELLGLAEKYIPRQCDTCAHWVDGDAFFPKICEVEGCLDLLNPDRWQWQHAAAMQELGIEV